MSGHVRQFFAHNPVTRNLNLFLQAFLTISAQQDRVTNNSRRGVRTYHTEALLTMFVFPLFGEMWYIAEKSGGAWD